jgi:uncharacterized protein
MQVAAYHVRIERHQVGEIPALLFRAEGTAEDAPLVFALHGLTSRKERHLDLCLRLAEAGFRACAPDARSHGERRSEDSAILSGDRTHPDFLPVFSRAVAGTVEDVMRLAGYFGGEQYGIVGHSMGGYIALHTALADARAAVLVSIAGVLDVSQIPRAFLPPEVAALVNEADVHGRASEFGNRPLLLLHGDADIVVPVSGSRRLREMHSSLRLVEYPGIGHEFLPAMAEESVAFLSEHFAPRHP